MSRRFRSCAVNALIGIDVRIQSDTIKDVPYRVLQTETFAAWHGSLRDMRAKVAIARRTERIEAGTLGDVKSLGGAVSELRFDIGPGYRLYFTMRNAWW